MLSIPYFYGLPYFPSIILFNPVFVICFIAFLYPNKIHIPGKLFKTETGEKKSLSKLKAKNDNEQHFKLFHSL